MTTVLLVDHDCDSRRRLRHALALLGLHTVAAADGRHALELVRACLTAHVPLDAVLTDIDTPGPGPLLLPGHLADMLPGVPLCVMSRCRVQLGRARGGERVVALLEKPVAPNALAVAMRAALASAPGDSSLRAAAAHLPCPRW